VRCAEAKAALRAPPERRRARYAADPTSLHHVGNLVLRRNAELVGYKSNFTILDREDGADLMNLLRDELGIPGMVVMQFGFEGPRSNVHRLENHPRHAVVYAGTHDCDTALGWWRTLPARIRKGTHLLPKALGKLRSHPRKCLIRASGGFCSEKCL
jgi:hypothetical protein